MGKEVLVQGYLLKKASGGRSFLISGGSRRKIYRIERNLPVQSGAFVSVSGKSRGRVLEVSKLEILLMPVRKFRGKNHSSDETP